MAQGTRGRWVRVAAAGLGILVCGGLGCMNADKDKKDKVATKPGTVTPGLPGTPPVGTGSTASRPGTPQPYAGTVQQTGGVSPTRVGSPSDGQNTLRTSVPQQTFGNPGSFGSNNLGAPANPSNPGFVPSVGPVNPAGGTAPGGYTGYNTNFSPSPAAPAGRTAANSPPPVQLTDVGPLPPARPDDVAGAAPLAPVASPLAPLPPVGLQPGATARAAGQ